LVATKSKEHENGTAHKDLYIQDGKDINILAYNAGRLCPPSCPKPGDADDWGGVGVTVVDRGEKGMVIV
jgi:hypothetical protein